MGTIRVGVAGWDYPDWKGYVYPAHVGAGFDRLAFLAGFVDVLEINSTFYRDAAPRTAESWARRTEGRPGFRFTAKAHHAWTHDDESDSLPAAVTATLEGLTPLRDAGLLGALLLQFPQRFHDTRASRERVERLVDGAAGWPLVVEVRHVSWDRDECAAWLENRGVGWCVVDQPRVGRSTAPPRPRVAGRLGYLRLHGRNTASWFREGAGRDERYDYLYPHGEMRQLSDAALEMGRAAEELYVVQNNHFRGQALVNALQMKHRVEGSRPAAPPDLVRAYPELAEIVSESQSRLF